MELAHILTGRLASLKSAEWAGRLLILQFRLEGWQAGSRRPDVPV